MAQHFLNRGYPMTSVGAHHQGHAVQFYETDEFLIDLIADFVKTSREAGEMSIIVCTAEHAEYLKNTLRLRYSDCVDLNRPDHIQFFDAAELLASFVVHGRPDPELFVEIFEPLVRNALKSSGGVRIFGEMVALLWNERKYEAAIALEQFWNDLRNRLSFTLLCAYPMAGFSGPFFASRLAKICNQHTIAIPAESFSSLLSEEERLQQIVELQQKATSLESMKEKLELQMIELKTLNQRIHDQLKDREMILRAERIAKRDAQHANRIKDEFLAMISHELRTPLTSLFGWSRLLRTGNLQGAAFTRALEVIERSAYAQMQLIEDLLDASTIFGGKLRLEISEVNLDSLLNRALVEVQPQAASKEISINASAPSPLPLFHGDARRLQQVVSHLLSNAIKFSDKGGTIRVSLSSSKDLSSVELEVRDHGAGISPEFAPYLFRRFTQQDGTITRKKGGLGLGLALARHLVEAHGGTITAESAGVGKGSTFTVRLPFNYFVPSKLYRSISENQAQLPEKILTALVDVRMLIVDAGEQRKEMHSEIARQWKAKVFSKCSAEEALEALNTCRPDIVIVNMDLHYSGAVKLLHQIRCHDAGSARIPVIGISSAQLSPEIQRRTIIEGFNLVLIRPEPEDLALGIYNLLGLAYRTF